MSGGERLNVAVVGSGVAGLSAAWLLSERHNVTLFEADHRLGGHAHTAEAPGFKGPVPVDTGFIVYNEGNYPNFTALLAHLGVPSLYADMSLSVSLDDGAFEYSSFASASSAPRPATSNSWKPTPRRWTTTWPPRAMATPSGTTTCCPRRRPSGRRRWIRSGPIRPPR